MCLRICKYTIGVGVDQLIPTIEFIICFRYFFFDVNRHIFRQTAPTNLAQSEDLSVSKQDDVMDLETLR